VSEPDQIEPERVGPPQVPAPPPSRAAGAADGASSTAVMPRWGLGDAAAGWLLGLVGGSITGSIAIAASGVGTDGDLPFGWFALAQLGLWFGYIGVPWFAARLKGNGIVRDFGLRIEGWWDAFVGVGVGLGSQLLVLPLIYIPILLLLDKDTSDVEQVARDLTDRATDPLGVALLVLVVAIGAPIAEEIFYRGLVFRSMEKRFGTWPGIIGSGLWFGAAHLQPLQFPGLAAFGIILAYLTHRTGRLAPAIFAHMAFNLVTVIVLVAG
jgi:membrane protease YdiL (CAAX protease family)